ncbi:MAG: hypothetical protein GY799_30360 [Desulfobulbaceae bacterium]|nr:hypothetical protein [Desulfobulbaceae bacterium]
MKRILKIVRNSTIFFFLYLLISFSTISLYPLVIEDSVSLSLQGRIVYSLLSSLVLLIPSLFYVSRKTTGDYIDAVKIEELHISENEIKNAISNWVFAKHGKSVMGDVELYASSTDGKISCTVNIAQD